MKFSALLPTRNRLELLKFAVESVRRQNYQDWEIVVSDNASEEDIAGYIHSLHEPRIQYLRTESFVPVTENWNNALDHCTGDYVVMLGDDDCLLKDYFRSAKDIIERFNTPDCIYSNALLYAYPGVMPTFPDGFLKRYDHAEFFGSLEKPFVLDLKQARALARQSMHMRMSYTYNMQHSLVSRQFIESQADKGAFFQSPYPDFYATNVIFLIAEKIVINPKPSVVIGISPKSFGYYFFNDQEEAGTEFLNNLPDTKISNQMKDRLLPGSRDKTSWLIAMETIKMNYGSEMKLTVAYNRYRVSQVLGVYRRYVQAKRGSPEDLAKSKSEMDSVKRNLAAWEKVIYLPLLWTMSKLVLIIPISLKQRLHKFFMAILNKTPQVNAERQTERFENTLEVFERADLNLND